MVVRFDVRNVKGVGHGGQRGCRQWSVPLVTLISCRGGGEQRDGILQIGETQGASTLVYWRLEDG